jgi:hypothetical protein
MTDEQFTTTTNDKGQHKWVWVGPGGSEFHGPGWHKTRAAAIRAGKKWLDERSKT